MNEHPGVRPVIVQPQQSSPPSLQTLARNASAMPVGLSANSVGLGDGHAFNVRRLISIGIPVAMVLLIALASWLFVRNTGSLTTFSLTNGAYEYSFLFYKSSEPVNLVAGEGLRYGNKALAIAKPTSDDVVRKCEEIGSKEVWKQATTVFVEGNERPVCTTDNKVFVVTFFHGKVKHLLEVTYTTSSPSATQEVRQIMQSVKVSLE